jgi:hypothetical protein
LAIPFAARIATMLFFLLRVTVELGVPVAALTWLLFYRLYHRGELARDANHKAIRSSLKAMKAAAKESKTPADSVLHAKWMRLGGGFYGVAALWTLVVMEAGGIVNAIVEPSSVEDMFRGGVVDFGVNLLVGQITTFVQALVWFTWWSGNEHHVFGCIAIAYLGYLAGLNLARRETAVGSRLVGLDWRARVRSWFGDDDDV